MLDPDLGFYSGAFDRTTNGERIHFSSAMTLPGYGDGIGAEDGCIFQDKSFMSARCKHICRHLRIINESLMIIGSF